MLLVLLASIAQAESWCATPLVVHEWGVQVLRTDGVAVEGTTQPAHFHDAFHASSGAGRVRDLPADSGIRELPVVHFYAPLVWGDSVPVGIEVGFTDGVAASWYPQVDRLSTGSGGRKEPAPQLVWDALTLTAAPRSTPEATDVRWVGDLRGIEALWVNRGAESERFLFYEADTTERPAVTIVRGDSWTPDRPHYVLRNTSDWTVHDVFVVQHGPAPVGRSAASVAGSSAASAPDGAGEPSKRGDGGLEPAGPPGPDGDFVFFAPAIPPGRSAGFLLDAHPFADPAAVLRARLVDPAGPPTEVRWDQGCVMMRDPAAPATTDGHRLYEPEADALLEVWKERFFAAPGTTIVYREDPAALDALMPLAVYTDMYHHVDLRRTGLVVWEGVVLP